MKVAVVGAGAAGCFAALVLRRLRPDIPVDIFESGNRPLAKLALTGGGRCNLTNTFETVTDLGKVYPRGERLMRRALSVFGPRETMDWWEKEGVALHVEDAGRVFPDSGDAMQVVRTLLRGLERSGVPVHCRRPVRSLAELSGYERILIASGGGALDMLAGTETAIQPCVPSLFGLALSPHPLRPLSGLSVPSVRLAVSGLRCQSEGAMLLTHAGVSGPAVLRLSSYAARDLAERGYRCELAVGWLDCGEEEAYARLQQLLRAHPARLLASVHPEALPARLWELLLSRAGLRADIRCAEVGSKGLRRLAALLAHDVYSVSGRNRNREEFVTCGGVSLDAVNWSSLESKIIPGLHFAGEVLDVDAVTGGFNLQAAWSTAYLVASFIARNAELI